MTASAIVRESVAVADPNNPQNVLVPNATSALAVTPSDSTTFTPPAIGLWVGTGGNVAVRMFGSQTSVTFLNVPNGNTLPIQVDKVLSTGTSASDIVRLW